MTAIENWVKDIVFYMIFVTMIMNLLPDPKYEKYLRLFAGAVMILLAFVPLARITGMETAIAGMFEKIIFEDDEIGRASVGKECVRRCRSRWSPYH